MKSELLDKVDALTYFVDQMFWSRRSHDELKFNEAHRKVKEICYEISELLKSAPQSAEENEHV